MYPPILFLFIFCDPKLPKNKLYFLCPKSGPIKPNESIVGSDGCYRGNINSFKENSLGEKYKSQHSL